MLSSLSRTLAAIHMLVHISLPSVKNRIVLCLICVCAMIVKFSRQPLHYVTQGPRRRVCRRAPQRWRCAAAFPRVPAASAGPPRVLKANGECPFFSRNSNFLGQFRVHTRARATILLTPPEGGVILSGDFWDHGESTCYTANSSRDGVKTILRAGLLLLRLEKCQKANA